MNAQFPASRLTPVALATLVMLASPLARADEDEARALMQPTNQVEISLVGVRDTAPKFGEYNGLDKSGTQPVLGGEWRGGSAYSQLEAGGTRRYGLRVSDLGLSNAAARLDAADQGNWSLGLGVDRLKHVQGNGYQTPYVGAMGGNSFTLPPTFGLVTTTGAGAPGTNSLSAPQLAAFQPLGISTTRTNTSLTASLALDARWTLGFDYKHLRQTGAKLQGFGASGAPGSGVNGEVIAILPMPTDYRTDNFQTSVDWRGDKKHFSASYYGSFFRDANTQMTFQPYSGTLAGGATSLPMQIVTTPPNNDFHQINLAGGAALTAATKLSGNLSYSRNRQNADFVGPEAGVMLAAAPVSSLNGLVDGTHADARLTNQARPDLTLSTGVRYDRRENKTPSNMYNFYAIDGSANNAANYPNTPLSTRKSVVDVGADWRLKQGRVVSLGLAHESLGRWCENYATGTSATPGANGYYPAGTHCVVAYASRDDRLEASYRARLGEDADYKITYAYADRATDFDPFALAAFKGQNGAVPGPVPATGNTTPRGQNAGDYYGFASYFSASRRQNALKGSVNWQATEQLQLTASAKATDDEYGSQYGVQNGNSWSLNLDASYAYSDRGSVYTYVTQQRRWRDMTDLGRYTTTATAAGPTTLSVPAIATWSDRLIDQDFTLGIGFKQAGLLGGKLEVGGDLDRTLARTVYSTSLNYDGATNGLGTAVTGVLHCSDPQFLTCGQLPAITARSTQIRLRAAYQVNPRTQVSLGYLHRQFDSADYYYNTLQNGSTPAQLMPTNQSAAVYRVDVIGVNVNFNF